MKTYLRLGILVGALLCVSCLSEISEYSEEHTEDGSVYDVVYMPSGHSSEVAPGFTMNGDLTFTSVDINLPERYAVIFKCKHGKFVIDGNHGKELFQRLEKGDKVTINYLEKHRVIKRKVEDKIIVEDKLMDLDFLDAIKQKEDLQGLN